MIVYTQNVIQAVTFQGCIYTLTRGEGVTILWNVSGSGVYTYCNLKPVEDR